MSQNVYVEIENAPQLLDCRIILIMQFLSQGNFLFRRQKIQLSHIKFLSSHFEGYRVEFVLRDKHFILQSCCDLAESFNIACQ